MIPVPCTETRDRERTDSGLLDPVRATGQAAADLSEQAWIAATLETEDERVPGTWHTWAVVVSERRDAVLVPLPGKADTKRILAARACRATTGEVTFAKTPADHPELRGRLPFGAQQLDELVFRVLARPARVEPA
ncbi:hypothetical protein ACWD0Z_10740 [Streptomyces sp. NPDC003007]